MKRLSAAICLIVMLSFSACDKRINGLQPAGAGGEIEKFNIKDSHVKLDLSDSFRIDADINGYDINKISAYKLYYPDVSEDKIAEIFMPEGGYKCEDLDDGSVRYTKDKESLEVHIKDKGSDNCSYIEYIGDTEKEYGYIIDTTAKDLPTVVTDGEAYDLVKEKLDKLPIDYDDLYIRRLNYNDMNESYAEIVRSENDTSGEESSASNEEKLDENFRFNAGDDCYVITGRTKMKGLSFFSYIDLLFSYFDTGYGKSHNICAAVSSRGIEYIVIRDMYSAKDPYDETPVISPEKAVEALYLAYDSSVDKDKIAISIDKIDLIYEIDTYVKDPEIKGNMTPFWAIRYLIEGHDGGEPEKRICTVSVSDGIRQEDNDYLFSYFGEQYFPDESTG